MVSRLRRSFARVATVIGLALGELSSGGAESIYM
jgi:hypothetical protein